MIRTTTIWHFAQWADKWMYLFVFHSCDRQQSAVAFSQPERVFCKTAISWHVRSRLEIDFLSIIPKRSIVCIHTYVSSQPGDRPTDQPTNQPIKGPKTPIDQPINQQLTD
jgi:hypothetical protein